MRKNGVSSDGVFDRTWLLKARLTAKLRQEDVATAANISVGFYNRIENGVQIPNVIVGIAICDALGLDPHNFLNEKRVA